MRIKILTIGITTLVMISVLGIVNVNAKPVKLDYGSKVYYDDNSEQWLNASTKIKEFNRFGYKYAIETLSYRAYFKQKIKESQFSRFEFKRDSGDDNRIEFSVDSLRYRNSTTDEDIGTVNNVNGSVSDNTITWNNVYTSENGNTTIRIIADYSFVRIEAIVDGVPEHTIKNPIWIELVYELEVEGSECYIYDGGFIEKNSSFNHSKEVYFLNDKGEIICNLMNPVAEDLNDAFTYGNYYMEKTPTLWRVHKQISYAWFNNSERKFPVEIDPAVNLGNGVVSGIFTCAGKNIVVWDNESAGVVFVDNNWNLKFTRTLDSGANWGSVDTLDRVNAIYRPDVIKDANDTFHVVYGYCGAFQEVGYVNLTRSGDDWEFGTYTEFDYGVLTIEQKIIQNPANGWLHWFVCGLEFGGYQKMYEYISIDSGASWGSNSPSFNNGEPIDVYVWGSPADSSIDQLNVAFTLDLSNIMVITWQNGPTGTDAHKLCFIRSENNGLTFGTNIGSNDGNYKIVTSGDASSYHHWHSLICNDTQMFIVGSWRLSAGSARLHWYWTNNTFVSICYDNDTLGGGGAPNEYLYPSLSMDVNMAQMYLTYYHYNGSRYIRQKIFDIVGWNWSGDTIQKWDNTAWPDTELNIQRYQGLGDMIYYEYSDSSIYWDTFPLNNYPPSGSIDTPSNYSSYNRGEKIYFNSTGSDPHDSELLTYSWSSNIDGSLGSDEDFNTTSLSPGNHTITLSVCDSIDTITRYIYVTINATVGGSIGIGGGGSSALCCIGGVIVGCIAAFFLLSGRRRR